METEHEEREASHDEEAFFIAGLINCLAIGVIVWAFLRFKALRKNPTNLIFFKYVRMA